MIRNRFKKISWVWEKGLYFCRRSSGKLVLRAMAHGMFYFCADISLPNLECHLCDIHQLLYIFDKCWGSKKLSYVSVQNLIMNYRWNKPQKVWIVEHNEFRSNLGWETPILRPLIEILAHSRWKWFQSRIDGNTHAFSYISNGCHHHHRDVSSNPSWNKSSDRFFSVL